jgi:transposase
VKNDSIQKTLEDAKQAIDADQTLSASMRTLFNLLIFMIQELCRKLNINSANSSKAPSQDPNRSKPERKKGERKPGGQIGRTFATLEPVDTPDTIKTIKVNRKTYPTDRYKHVGYKTRQVFDIQFKRVVTEYRAEIVEDAEGKQIVAPFPPEVTRPTQYGASVKEHVVFLSCAQFLPAERLIKQFHDQYKMALSCGSVFNFIEEAAFRLEPFKTVARHQLKTSAILNADETGINVNSKLHWLHGASNTQWTWLEPHAKRGALGMEAIGIIPDFKGVLIHDHLKAYFTFACQHALCNAHHLRELTWSFEEDKQAWAGEMRTYLEELNRAVIQAGGCLTPEAITPWYERYHAILTQGNEECPVKPPDLLPDQKKKRGKVKQSKSRNLLDRLINFQTETLRFAAEQQVPFTNNLAERIIRMEKVKQKISGCFKSLETAKQHAIIRSYLLTCQQNDVSCSDGLRLLFQGTFPQFVLEALEKLKT